MHMPIISAGFQRIREFVLGFTYKYDKHEQYIQLVVSFGYFDFVLEIS